MDSHFAAGPVPATAARPSCLHYRMTADADPGLLPRVLQVFAKRSLVPDTVRAAYGGRALAFGPEYLIPTPFDPRVLEWVAPAVAQAAMESGVARRTIDLDAYRGRLRGRGGIDGSAEPPVET